MGFGALGVLSRLFIINFCMLTRKLRRVIRQNAEAAELELSREDEIAQLRLQFQPAEKRAKKSKDGCDPSRPI